MAHEVVLYTKEGCCLCDRAKQVLLRLREEFDLQIEEVDITRDEGLTRQYGHLVPVVILDGEHRFASKVTEYHLRRALAPSGSGGRRWPWRR